MIKNEEDYYKAYDLRYKQIHSKGLLWELTDNTPLVLEFLNYYGANNNSSILDLGCGEGRDAIYLLENNYNNLLAIDYSIETIKTCNKLTNNLYKSNFKQLDIINDELTETFDYIYSISVLHMFILQKHRNKYWNFIFEHLNRDGKALITVLGDGNFVKETKIEDAFKNSERVIQSNNEKVVIANTSCKIVTWSMLEKEIKENNLTIEKKWLSHKIPGFDNSMCVIVKKNK